MNDDKWNELLNGPLHHPMVSFTLTRLILALRYVVDATGEPGEKALLEYCRGRDERDQQKAADS